MSEFQISAPDFSGEFTVEYKVSEGMWLYKGTLVAILKRPKDEQASEPSILKVKTEQPGKVVNLLKPKGGRVKSLYEFQSFHRHIHLGLNHFLNSGIPWLLYLPIAVTQQL